MATQWEIFGRVAVSFLFGVYQGIWRYTSLPDIQRLVFSVFCGTVFVSIAAHTSGIDGRFGYRSGVKLHVTLVTLTTHNTGFQYGRRHKGRCRSGRAPKVYCKECRGRLLRFGRA